MNNRLINMAFFFGVLQFILFSESFCADIHSETDRLALVIGNWKYSDAPLVNPQNDSREMDKVLSDARFHVFRKDNLNMKSMEQALNLFLGKIEAGDAVVVYYAGHAIQSKGQNFLVPLDANIRTENDVMAECISINPILAKITSCRPKHTILILDACRNNPFLKLNLQSSSRSVMVCSNDAKNYIYNRGLVAITATPGLLVAYATAPGMVAMDGKNDSNSPFTGALIKHIRARGQTVENVFRAVRREVVDATDGFQVPWDENRLLDSFYFHPVRGSQSEIKLRTAPMGGKEVRSKGHFETKIIPGKWVKSDLGVQVWQPKQVEEFWVED